LGVGVELLRQYSNRSDLLDDLTKTLERVQKERRTGSSEEEAELEAEGLLRAVRSPQVWRIHDRLTSDDIARMIEDYHAGATLRELAARYSIGLTNVKRLLREHKARRKDRRDSAA
jgi:hypothetical protein